MPKNSYTLLILPKRHSSAKKMSVSGTLVKGVSLFVMGLILVMMYFSYDYIHIRRNQVELKRLRQQTVEQRKQIEGLAAKIDEFAIRMETLNQFDKKIRIMANLETGRDREQFLGIGGPMSEENRVRSKIVAEDKKLIAGVHRNVDRLMNEAVSQARSFTALLNFLKEKKSILEATPSLWPPPTRSAWGWRTATA